jgi:DNA-binding transcriptional ArsR family regulator
MSQKITLDLRSFKALAAESRVEILKTLSSRRHTATELGNVLNMKSPSVRQHLDALISAGLVSKHDEGRKWKYYSLTKQGRGIVEPEDRSFTILLTSTVLSALGSVYAFYQSTFSKGISDSSVVFDNSPTIIENSVDSEILYKTADPFIEPVTSTTAEAASVFLDTVTDLTLQDVVFEESAASITNITTLEHISFVGTDPFWWSIGTALLIVTIICLLLLYRRRIMFK